jgi:hypothetical protein
VPPYRPSEEPPVIAVPALLKLADKTYVEPLGRCEWWLPQPAAEISVSAGKLTDWVRRGWVHTRKTPPQWLWVLLADGQEVKRFRKLTAFSHRGVVEYPTETHYAEEAALAAPPTIKQKEGGKAWTVPCCH